MFSKGVKGYFTVIATSKQNFWHPSNAASSGTVTTNVTRRVSVDSDNLLDLEVNDSGSNYDWDDFVSESESKGDEKDGSSNDDNGVGWC